MPETHYLRKALSAYEGEKRLDRMRERAANGEFKPKVKANREPAKDHLCQRCSRRKRSQVVVPCLTMGEALPDTPFRGKFLVCCAECAAELTRAGVPQAAAEQVARMKALGLVMP